MIYVDHMQPCMPNKNWRWKENCHLFGDSLEELQTFAMGIGLKAEWLQGNEPGRTPHFDLIRGKRALAVRHGAKPVEGMQLVRIIRRLRVPYPG